MVHLLVHHHALIDKPCDVSNALYNSTSLSFFVCVLFTESPAYSVLFTSSLLSCLPQDQFGATPLITACGENHLPIVRVLIENRANINYQKEVFDNLVCFHNLFTIPHIPQQNGNSPLQCACIKGHLNIAKFLIQSNANIELKNKVGSLDNHT